MRDGNRLKEKIELRLDRRQVTSLSVVALLLSASIFALGVMVGKNLAPPAKPNAPTEALLDRLDAQADAGAGLTAEPLTFQDELTKKLPASSQTKPPRQPLPAAPSAPKEAPAPAARQDIAAADQSVAAGKQGTLGLKDLVERDSGVEVAAAPNLTAPRLASPQRAFFTVQVKATQSSKEADKFAQRLRGQGYPSLVAEAEVIGKGKWYRVRVGKFDTRPQADHYLEDFKRETHLEAFVTAAGH